MKLSRVLIILALVYFVDCRNNVKALTDSMGSEVIEIGPPVKELQELPPGVEEEPSAEADEETTSRAPPQPVTKRETKRVLTTTTTSTQKEVEKEDSISQEEDEARIEKELAEIYKDTDYKSDSSDTLNKELKEKIQKVELNVTEEKPIGRSRMNFKFQPDVNNRADIERFRTSVDEISCDRRVTQRLSAESSTSNATSKFVMNFIQICLVILALIICH